MHLMMYFTPWECVIVLTMGSTPCIDIPLNGFPLYDHPTSNNVVQDGLQRDDSHLCFYMLSRAQKTHVREKLKEYQRNLFLLNLYNVKDDKLLTVRSLSLSIQTIMTEIKYRIITR